MLSVLRQLFLSLVLVGFAGCGGGDGLNDPIRFGSRSCPGSFGGDLAQACPVELRLTGSEMISVEVAGYLVTQVNESPATVEVLRMVCIEVAGQLADVRILSLKLAPGMGNTLLFTLRAEVPAQGLRGAPVAVGLTSTPQFGYSAVTGLVVTAIAR